MSRKAWRESVAAAGVVASLVFVGMEIRASTTQARAAAYQEVGLATAALHLDIDDRSAQLAAEQGEPESLATWSATDWHRSFRTWLGIFRIWETLQLQVHEGVLPPEALESLGWHNTPNIAWNSLAFVCFWPAIRQNTSGRLISLMEDAEPQDLPACPVEVIGVPGM